MAGFLYFISKLQSVSKENINNTGLNHIFGNSSFSFVPVSSGPGKQSGAVVVITPENSEVKPPQIGYFPDKQDWQEGISKKFWLGKEKANPPKPIDLQRTELIGGHLTKLEDGNEWLIPVARIFPQGTMLPQSLILGPNGELVKETLPRFAQLGKKAERVWNETKRQVGWLKDGETSEPIDEKEGWDIVIEALSINYRIGQDEVSFLRLLTTENMLSILHALIDFPTIMAVIKSQQEAFKKKAQSDTQDTKITKDGNKA